jgi:hypothetical protein
MDFEYGRVTMSEDDNLSDKDDRLIQRYDTILKESALLTTFSAILFWIHIKYISKHASQF